MAKANTNPEVRFGSFTDDWEEHSLNDISNLLTGYPFPSKQFQDEGILLVRGMNVKRGYLDLSKSISKFWNTSQGLEMYLLQEGDVVIQMDGALIGKSYAKIEAKHLPALLVQRVTRLRSDLNTQELIYQYIQRDFPQYINSIKTETAVPHLSLNDIKNFRLSVPKKPEERLAIGNFLLNIDQLINEHQQRQEKLKALKKAMLSKMFPQGGRTVPEIRFKGFVENWQEKTFGEILNYERPDNYIVKSTEYSNLNRTPVLTANKGFILGYTNEINTFKDPCIIFDDFTLDCKLVNFPFMVKSSALKILTIKNENLDDLRFVFHRLGTKRIEKMGHARHYISVVQETKMLAPKIDEQKLISKYFKNLEDLITNYEVKIAKINQLKKAFLSKMFI